MRLVGADVGHLMRDDQMVRRIDGSFARCSRPCRSRPLVAIEWESGSVSDIC
jgi:hypothetical protein